MNTCGTCKLCVKEEFGCNQCSQTPQASTTAPATFCREVFTNPEKAMRRDKDWLLPWSTFAAIFAVTSLLFWLGG